MDSGVHLTHLQREKESETKLFSHFEPDVGRKKHTTVTEIQNVALTDFVSRLVHGADRQRADAQHPLDVQKEGFNDRRSIASREFMTGPASYSRLKVASGIEETAAEILGISQRALGHDLRKYALG